jgi:hypothetical protein
MQLLVLVGAGDGTRICPDACAGLHLDVLYCTVLYRTVLCCSHCGVLVFRKLHVHAVQQRSSPTVPQFPLVKQMSTLGTLSCMPTLYL